MPDMPINQNFAEVASLATQHNKLAVALQGVFDELIKKIEGGKEDWQTAAADICRQKSGAWNTAASDWANSQGNLANVVGRHNEDVQATDLGPASNVFNNIAI